MFSFAGFAEVVRWAEFVQLEAFSTDWDLKLISLFVTSKSF